MSPFFYVVPFFFLLIALEYALARRRGLEIYRLQDTVTSINTGIVSQAVNVLGAGVSVYMYSLMVDAFGLFTWDTSQLWIWVFGLVLYDFCYYWVHRTGHEVNLFWAAHVIHHSSEDFNLATALRQSATGFWFKWVFYAPLALLGFPVKMFVILGLIDLLYQYWVHTQLVGRMGVLERFMVTPANHRVHHGQNDYCIDRNYGGIFSIWDKMFGTYADERSDEKVIYGVRKPLRSWDPVWGNVHHYFTIGRAVRGAADWRERLGHVFGPPRGPSQLAAAAEPPFHPEEFVPFATPAPRFMRVIGVCSTLFGAAVLMTFYWLLPGLSFAQSLLYMAAMLAFFSLIGQLWLHPRVTGATAAAGAPRQ
ncbi:MAG: sterol desaturase family protein [Gammaproteobacteria bacterium]